MVSAKQETSDVRELVVQILRAREAYYNGPSPIISDAEYDALENVLKSKHPEHPVFRLIGASHKDSGWEKIQHGAPMGSQAKVQNQDELRSWWNNRHKQVLAVDATARMTCVVSDKLDGISISLCYQEGHLVRAVSRGDGETGDDITPNVFRMKGVVYEIPGFSGYLRGEIVVLKFDHAFYFPGYSNPRNTAAGIARRLNGKDSEYLTVITYQAISDTTLFDTKLLEFEFLQNVGCITPHHELATSYDDVERIYQFYISGNRDALDYLIDGLVIDINSTDISAALGIVDGRPKGAVAYKFPHEMGATTLLNLKWQVGNSGRITPVAIFEPVYLAGAEVKRASLHTIANLQKIGLGLAGDQILISRRNDVIPYVEKMLMAGSGPALVIPNTCPVCDSSLVMVGEYLACPNHNCPARVSGSVKRWVKKIGLDYWGETIITDLCNSGKVSSIAEMYKLTVGYLAEFSLASGRSVGEKTAVRLIAQRDSKKSLPLAVLIGSLGIDLCGRSICETIVEAGYDTLDKMQSASAEEIAAIPGLGEIKAQSFTAGLYRLRNDILNLLDYGISVQTAISGNLNSLSFCFTGFRSADLELSVQAAGGKMKSGVSKSLDYLVCKDINTSSGKIKSARSNGHTKIISREEIADMVN